MNVFNIIGGSIYQWDIGRKLKINLPEEITADEVHFAHDDSMEALVLRIYTENNELLVDIPNILIQSSKVIKVWLVNENQTICGTRIFVTQRAKPSDYVYTETEVLRYETLEKRIEALEKGGGAVNGVQLDPELKDNTKAAPASAVGELKNDLAGKVPKKDYAPETKTESMTQPVGKDENGKLWTVPGSGSGGGTWKTLAEFYNTEEVSELVFGSDETPLNIRNFVLAFSGKTGASNSNPLLGECGYYGGVMSVDNSVISLSFYLSDGTSRTIITSSIRNTRNLFFTVDLDRGLCAYRSGFFNDIENLRATNFYFSNAKITKIVVSTVADGCVFKAQTEGNKIYLFTFGG